MVMEKWLVDGPKVIDLEVVRSLKISLIGGKVDVIAHDGPGVRVEVHSVAERDLKVSISGDSLEIDHPQFRWENVVDVFRTFSNKVTADISVAVPREVSLKLALVTADALVVGLKAPIKINTMHGEVILDSNQGKVDLNTVAGELSVRAHEGELSVHTVSANVTASGAISEFSCDGVSGNVFLDVIGAADTISNNTVSGDFTVRFDEELAARYTLNSVSGSGSIEGDRIVGLLGKGYNRVTGNPDGAFVEIRANSVAGPITSIRRGAASGNAAGEASETAESSGAADSAGFAASTSEDVVEGLA